MGKLKMEKTEKIFLYVVGAIILIILLITGISNLNNQDKITCNSPYIKVGTSCCLDENSNAICDNNEIMGEPNKEVWEFSNRFNVYGGEENEFLKCYYEEGYYYGGEGGSLTHNYDQIYDLSPRNIRMSLKKTDKEGNSYTDSEYYRTAIIAVYTDYDLERYGSEPEGVTCEVEEYYDGVFNEVNTNQFKLYSELPDDKYGFIAYYGYKIKDKPSEAKYIISCKGDKSGNEIKRTFTFNIEYVDELEKVSC